MEIKRQISLFCGLVETGFGVDDPAAFDEDFAHGRVIVLAREGKTKPPAEYERRAVI